MSLKVSFLLIAVIASVFGFSGIVGGATETAGRVITAIYVALFVGAVLVERVAVLHRRKKLRGIVRSESAQGIRRGVKLPRFLRFW
ncbi:DUF1328 domain-containing protein [Histidinibacterium aquaticum]|uniref:DUF1328 domain-containing protein n=1 Tax=Histidinibacterium aquaticum TaxID=2613962 RepID=A0A5J5GS01_9RHOB|nr:DUF1328 domain-containing protein [Histidinibacterium aquaticum]